MKVIGLTGSFGTGKTTVAAIFRSLGARVIDADKIAHGCIKKGTSAYRKIVRFFGRKILTGTGAIDRGKLAAIVFDDSDKRTMLEAVIHPEVTSSIMARISKARLGDIVIIDAPLLLEADLDRIVDELIVVKSSRKRQIERSMKKFGLTRDGVARRIASQIPLRKKIEIADFVIDNNGTISETKKQVRKVWGEIWK